jgi:hypothetical protein
MTETGDSAASAFKTPITIRRKVQSLNLPRPSRLNAGEVAGALTQSVQLINNILEEPRTALGEPAGTHLSHSTPLASAQTNVASDNCAGEKDKR